MTANRTVRRRMPRLQITAEAVALFQLAAEYARTPGTRREYLTASKALRQLCGLAPWSFNPVDPALDGPKPDYIANLASAATWEPARALRRALLAELDNEGAANV